MTKDRLVTVYRAFGQLEAQVIKTKLESAGIPVLLKYESAGLVFGLTVNGLGEVQVQVPAQWEDSARKLLKEPGITEEAESAENAEDTESADDTENEDTKS